MSNVERDTVRDERSAGAAESSSILLNFETTKANGFPVILLLTINTDCFL